MGLIQTSGLACTLWKYGVGENVAPDLTVYYAGGSLRTIRDYATEIMHEAFDIQYDIPKS